MEVTGRLTRAISITAADETEIGSARRQGLALATTLDFDELRCGQLGIVITEAARNLSTHGGGGEILLTPWRTGDLAGIDVLAIDRGPGIADVGMALQDGYSTGATPGTGLGAIARLAQTFQVYSQPAGGTAVLARLLRSSAEADKTSAAVHLSSIGVAYAEETVSGDGWAARVGTGRSVYFMADGLGHGPIAAVAAETALRSFAATSDREPKEILLAAHSALLATRGAALAVAHIDQERRLLRYVGSGNIASQIVSGGNARSLVSMNGTPGHRIGTLQEFVYPMPEGASLVMHSDGLATRWNLADYPGLAARDPALIAGILYRDFSRKRDDATVLVAREGHVHG